MKVKRKFYKAHVHTATNMRAECTRVHVHRHHHVPDDPSFRRATCNCECRVCVALLGNRYGPGVIPLEGTWGCRMLTLHLDYVAGYTCPLLFLSERTRGRDFVRGSLSFYDWGVNLRFCWDPQTSSRDDQVTRSRFTTRWEPANFIT